MKELKKKLLKVKKIKFIRNILIGVISLLIVAAIINIAPGYKRDKYKDVVNLIINEENKTEQLKHDIYINNNKTVYISEEDIKNLLDATIYYDEKYNQIITTSDRKVASIVIDEKKMIVNDAEIAILDAIIRINNIIYLPISDMDTVYNIDIKYVEETNRVIIDKLDTGMIKSKVAETSQIKFKPRKLSKNIGEVVEGESVTCFYTTSKGWRQIRTSDGTIGYIKANKLASEYIVRQDMLKNENAIKISKDLYNTKQFEITENEVTKKIILQELFTTEGEKNNIKETSTQDKKVWVSIANKFLINSVLEDYKNRTEFINSIVEISIENNINGISIETQENTNNDNIKRFIIELAPKLREVGITTCVVTNGNSQDYINIVDYIVE